MSTRKALILSPSASHPQDYGNRNRVFQTTSRLKEAGFEIHFVLYPYESDWVHGMPDSAADIRKAWDSFAVIPPSKVLHAGPQGSHHEIDEWWDPQIGSYLEWLFARETFDVFIVNYTFLSKAFEFAPQSVIKVLETHDIFSGRKELFLAHGARPEFFYTTADREKIALDRADVVVAIKDAEAEFLRSLTSREVVSVPFDVRTRPIARRPERLEMTQTLKAGFIGAHNTVNVLNMTRFLERFAKFERIYVPPPIEIHVAGNVCSQLRATSENVKLLGHVESVEKYYDGIDVVVAPMVFSTGIKIKVGEALSFGKAVVSTKNGFDGFPAMDEFHTLEDVDAVCRALMKLAFDRERLKALEARSEISARLAGRRSVAGYDALLRAIGHLLKAIVFVTDQPLWNADTLEQERLTQWADLCSGIAPTVVVYLGKDAVRPFPRDRTRHTRHAQVIDAKCEVDKAISAIEDFSRWCNIADVVISASAGTGRAVWEGLHRRFDSITLDTWVPELAEICGGETAATDADIWLSRSRAGSRGARFLSTTALRYLPESLRALAGKWQSDDILIVPCKPNESDLRGLDVLRSIAQTPTGAAPSDSPTLVFCEAGMRAALDRNNRPAAILVIGRDKHAIQLWRSLAGLLEIAFVHLSADQFPIALFAGETHPELCYSFADISRWLPALTEKGRAHTTEYAADTGWSSYWREVSAR